MTDVDKPAQDLWGKYTEYKAKMFEHTNTELAPWKIIEANRKTDARIEALQYILDNLPYE